MHKDRVKYIRSSLEKLGIEASPIETYFLYKIGCSMPYDFSEVLTELESIYSASKEQE